MKFLVLMAEQDHAARWDALGEEGQEAVFERFRAFTVAVRDRGEVVTIQALQPPGQARTVRAGESEDRPITDGPFAETVEQMCGFWVIEQPDLQTALNAARLLPTAYSIEVRPLMDID